MRKFWTALLVAVIVANTAVAASNTTKVTSKTPIVTQSGLEVRASNDQQYELDDPWVKTDTLELQNVRFSGSGGAVEVQAYDSNGFTNLTNVNAPSGGVTVNRSAAQNTTTLRDDITDADVTDPSPVQKGDTDLVYQAASDSQVTVDTNDNGVVVVDLSSGNAVDEARPDANGKVTFTVPKATSDNAIGLREGPDALTLRPVDSPRSRISSTGNVNVTFYEQGTDRVFIREANNGRVGFAGLPKTSEFVARTGFDNYTDRRVLVTSIFEQNSLYLLNSTRADTVNVSFSVTDNTGQFGTDSTLQIQRALNTTDSPDGEKRYVAVSGAVLGETREFSTTLERGVRYRIIITNDGGRQRQLGAIVPENPRVYNLEVTGLDFSFNKTGTTATVNTTADISGSGANKQKTLTFVYNDPANETTGLDVTIHERGNPSNVLTTTSPTASSFPLGTFKFQTTVSGSAANTSYVATYSYDRLGEEQSAVQPFRGGEFQVDFPLSPGWQSIFGVGLLLVLGGVFSVANARIGALIIPGVALLLYQIGFLTGSVSLLGIGVAFSVAVAYNLSQNAQAVLGP